MNHDKDQFAQDLGPTLQEALGSRYEGFSYVARGGMGAVYRARHRLMHQNVAVKILFPGESTNRFQREARLLAKIRSPNVVIVHDFEMLPNQLSVLVMDWIEGNDLATRIRQHEGALPEDEVVRWMRDVCTGMAATAKEGIVHRDLKPSNVMIDRNNSAWVTDFGLAREPIASETLTSAIVGTPHYMSPEQAERPDSTDTRSDIYSFGATFYKALTGETMFDGESAFAVLFKHKTEPVIPPRTRNPSVSNRVSELIERCVAKWPDDRFQSFDEVMTVLEPTANQEASPWDEVHDKQLGDSLTQYYATRPRYLDAVEPFDDSYVFPTNRTLRITSGDFCGQRVDAIVSSDDELLSMSGGVSYAISAKAGPGLTEEAARFRQVRQGRAVVTSAGNLPQRFVFHGVTLDYSNEEVLLPSRDVIAEIIDSCFYHAETLHVESMAFPLLGTGAGGFPRNVCLDTMFRVLARMLLRRPTCVRDVRIVIRLATEP